MSSKDRVKQIGKYNKENYDEFKVRVKKGEKKIIQDYAKKKGKTLNKFVTEAIKDKMEQK